MLCQSHHEQFDQDLSLFSHTEYQAGSNVLLPDVVVHPLFFSSRFSRALAALESFSSLPRCGCITLFSLAKHRHFAGLCRSETPVLNYYCRTTVFEGKKQLDLGPC